jgi:hypothetical protein
MCILLLRNNEKKFIVSKIGPQDGSPCIYSITDPNATKSSEEAIRKNFPQSPFGIGMECCITSRKI